MAVAHFPKGFEQVADGLGSGCGAQQLQRPEGDMVRAEQAEGTTDETSGDAAPAPTLTPECRVVEEHGDLQELCGCCSLLGAPGGCTWLRKPLLGTPSRGALELPPVSLGAR